MSRIGKQPVSVPAGVTVSVDNGSIEVKGPKGTLVQALPGEITIELSEGQIDV